MDKAYTVVCGGAGSGKTSTIVRRAQQLLSSGVTATDILLLVPSMPAKLHMLSILAKVNISILRELQAQVKTISELGLGILSSEDVQRATGRVVRLLNSVEELFLEEDIKTTGLKPGRLRGMLDYFYRCFAELQDEEDGFLRDADEFVVLDCLRKQLDIRQAMLGCELSATALRYLRDADAAAAATLAAVAVLEVTPTAASAPEAATPVPATSAARAAAGYAHVLADDFPALSRASQQLAELLALKSLVVSGSPLQPVPGGEPYPYPQGFLDFAKAHPSAEVVMLDKARRTPRRISAIGNALVIDTIDDGSGTDVSKTCRHNPCEAQGDNCLLKLDDSQAIGQVKLVKWKNSGEEVSGLAEYLKQRLANDDGLYSSQVLVAAPNRVWARLMYDELRRRDVPVCALLNPGRLPGNPQRVESSKAMRIFTILGLSANASDIVSWRSWLGFGDYLANSAIWARLCAYCAGHEQDPLSALRQISEGYRLGDNNSIELVGSRSAPFAQAEKLALAYLLAESIGTRLLGQAGFGLIKALEQEFGELPQELRLLIEPLQGSETAAELYIKIRKQLSDPAFTTPGVRLGDLSCCYGLEPRLVVLPGLVDGNLPTASAIDPKADPDKAARLLGEQRLLLYNACMTSSEELILSYFQKEELERAAQLKLSISRIRVDHGLKMAALSPSRYLADMGPSLPGELSFI